MTIETLTIPDSLRAQYLGDGVQTLFPVPFPIFGEGWHVGAIISTGDEANPDERVLVHGIDYTVKELASGGELTTTVPVPSGQVLTLFLAIPIRQPRDFDNQGRLDAEELEKGLDYLTVLVGQNAAGIDRALQVAISSQQSSGELMQELFDARDTAVTAAGRACDCATAACDCAQRAETAALQTAEDVEKVSHLVDVQVLASESVNVRKSFILDTDVAAGGIVTLPAWYWPGRAHIDLRCDGVVCYLRTAGVELAGEYQFEEVGDISAASNQVILHFAAPAGSVFEVWVLSSITLEKYQNLEALGYKFTGLVLAVEGMAEQVEDDRERIEELALLFPDVAGASAGDTLLVTDDGQGGKALVWAAAGSPQNNRADIVLSAPLPYGTYLTVPAYRVGSHKLSVFLDGLLCLPGSNPAIHQYAEIGNSNDVSTSILFHDTLTAGQEVSALVEG